MVEDDFFDALAHVMWDMEVDIFSEKTKTLALVMDLAPRCRKQFSRLKVMYDCGAMDSIEQAIGNKNEYAELMWQAVDKTAAALNADEERAVFAVNKIIALWGGDLPELEAEDNKNNAEEMTAEEKNDRQEGDDVLFLQDVAEEQNEEKHEQQQAQEPEQAEPAAQEQTEQTSSDGGEYLLRKIIHFWCSNDCEQGRPMMAACPIGWIEILLCCAVGIFMIYDVTVGEKLSVPVFIFMYIVLIGKRHYRYDSVGRLSLALGAFYIAAAARALWVGSAATLRCVPIVIAALIVFNNGQFAGLLDGKKRRSAFAYTLIFLLSAVITAGAYAIQNVDFYGS